MTRFDRTPTELPKRGRGTGKPSVSITQRIKSEEKEERDLIGGYSETGVSPVPRPLLDPDSREALALFLAANPAMAVRDWKGLGFTWFSPFDPHYFGPLEQPWNKLDRAEVRRRATTTKARFLSRSYRMAAARDPRLIWDERSRSYRLSEEATPAQQEPVSPPNRPAEGLAQ